MEGDGLPEGLGASRVMEDGDRGVVKIHSWLKQSVTMGMCNTTSTTEEMNPALTARAISTRMCHTFLGEGERKYPISG